MSVFIRQRWIDSRLAYNNTNLGIKSLELDTRVIKDIWVPDLFVVNEKKATFHDITVPNKLMHIYPDGLVVYSMSLNVTKCYIEFIFPDVWTLYYYDGMKNLLKKILICIYLSLQWESLKHIYAININYTCIGLTFKLSRLYGYYLIQVYIPSFLIVVLSWLSFWLNIDAIPARISLGLLTVLTMTTQSSGARAELPRVSYVKAIDIWMATCLIFVFAALVEFAYVNVLARVEQRKKASIKDLPGFIHKQTEEENGGTENEWDKRKKKFRFLKSSANREKARTVDKVSRFLFPLIFVIFNVVYWTAYMLWKQVE
ncbi:LOW QUALITY PROTEIN: hypothetical protein KUTeg_024313 [Tegillarca granosa]|uniref:Uncharacterized protein n=1 Tax=Tegillarca granosa TaxID=220873 RepID=A0ABQ9E1K5_TEGGR|nr:LOW QUALITY PROTEIN: hypothetical protein KUTeg_024313 [Tegillarca granosa]